MRVYVLAWQRVYARTMMSYDHFIAQLPRHVLERQDFTTVLVPSNGNCDPGRDSAAIVLPRIPG